MIDSSVTEIAAALQGINSPPQSDESRLRIRLLRLVAEGRPVSRSQVEQTAASLQMSLAAATSFVEKVSERDEEGNIVGILGLSQRNHPHQFKVNGRVLSTWCAWDALFLPPLLGQQAEVESTCPVTQARVRVRITPEQVEEIDPPESVISIAVPKLDAASLKSVETIWKTFCCLVHFFVSPESALEWISAKQHDLKVLSVEDGFLLGRMFFEHTLEYV